MLARNFLLLTISATFFSAQLYAQSDTNLLIVKNRLLQIKTGLDSILFVKRFESVETPCLCIDKNNGEIAEAIGTDLSSNYKIQLKSDIIDPDGVRCLSQNYSRYMKLKVNNVDSMSGTIEFSYSYPASTIIQYLGQCYQSADKQSAFLGRLLKSSGTFAMYEQDGKYRIKISIHDEPFNQMDTVYGYLEIVREAFRTPGNISYVLYFDQMSIYRGNKNNQILLNFAKTSFTEEAAFYVNMAYNVLKKRASSNTTDKANALWLKNFLSNKKCESCMFIYRQAEFMVNHHPISLPNTEPLPAH